MVNVYPAYMSSKATSILVLIPVGSAKDFVDVRRGTITPVGRIIEFLVECTSIEYSDILVTATGEP